MIIHNQCFKLVTQACILQNGLCHNNVKQLFLKIHDSK